MSPPPLSDMYNIIEWSKIVLRPGGSRRHVFPLSTSAAEDRSSISQVYDRRSTAVRFNPQDRLSGGQRVTAKVPRDVGVLNVEGLGSLKLES